MAQPQPNQKWKEPVVPHPLGSAVWVSMTKRPFCGHRDCKKVTHRFTMVAWWLEIDRRAIGKTLDEAGIIALEV